MADDATAADAPEDADATGDDVAVRVRSYLLAEHRDLLETTLDCADVVAAGWEGDVAGRPATADRERVVGPLRAALERAGVLGRSPAVLAGCVDAAGFALPADPVAAPPYVVVTGRGLVLRATLDAGRLVVTLSAVRVERSPEGTRYVRDASDPSEMLDVAFR